MTHTTEHHAHSRLAHLPISLFATVMGLAGLTIATQKAQQLWHWHSVIALTLAGISTAVYSAIAIAYLLKWLRHPQAVQHEFNNPIRLSFFPASSIGLLLLSIVLLPYHTQTSLILWSIGAFAQLLFTLVILSNWIHHDRFQIQHSNPAWFIPIVGNILVPVAGVAHHHIEISWFFYSIGLMMWLPLLAVLLNRFFFHPMMPAKLLPTLFILIAPPAVGFISWLGLHQGVLDDVGRILYYFALFTTLLLVSQYRFFTRLSFALPWWAYSFPVAAISIATMAMAEHTGYAFFSILSVALYASLCVLMLLLVIKTLNAMRQGAICVPE